MQGKIHPLPRKQVISILESNGFQNVKVVKGRHMKFRKQTDTETLTTMVSHRPEIQPTTIRFIIKQSKKPEEEFYQSLSLDKQLNFLSFVNATEPEIDGKTF